MATTALQKFLNQLSRNKNVQGFVNEFNRLGSELTRRGRELNVRWSEEKEKTLKQAHESYQQMLVKATEAQKQLDAELKKAVDKIQTSAGEVEKGLEDYRRRANEQVERIEKVLRSRKAGSKKESGAGSASEKESNSTSRKASGKKASGKKAAATSSKKAAGPAEVAPVATSSKKATSGSKKTSAKA